MEAVPRTLAGRRVLDDEALADLGRRIAGARRGVIVCGPMDVPGFAAAVAGLAAATGYPILADALANVRFGPHDRSRVIARADALLRVAAFAEAHEPDLVLRFGGTPTSKALLGWLAATRATQVVVDDGGWNEPTGRLVTMVQAEPARLAMDLAGHAGAARVSLETRRADGWLASWQAAEAAAAEASAAWLAALAEPFEGQAFAELGDGPAGRCPRPGRQQHAGPRPGGLPGHGTGRHPLPGQPRRQRHRRAGLHRPRRGSGRRAAGRRRRR